jgi:hypothetical protein
VKVQLTPRVPISRMIPFSHINPCKFSGKPQEGDGGCVIGVDCQTTLATVVDQKSCGIAPGLQSTEVFDLPMFPQNSVEFGDRRFTQYGYNDNDMVTAQYRRMASRIWRWEPQAATASGNT